MATSTLDASGSSRIAGPAPATNTTLSFKSILLSRQLRKNHVPPDQQTIFHSLAVTNLNAAALWLFPGRICGLEVLIMGLRTSAAPIPQPDSRVFRGHPSGKLENTSRLPPLYPPAGGLSTSSTAQQQFAAENRNTKIDRHD
ncbi:MAG: hypothetical protein IPL00_11970 [Gammaproteobacteria bacterium]|nr:hypothetical protein [Gammaproteobacteria bacterium]